MNGTTEFPTESATEPPISAIIPRMKRILSILLAAALAVSAAANEPPSPRGGDVEFDAGELFGGSGYDDVSLLNKTCERISLTVFAWSPDPGEWVRYGTLEAGDYNERATLSRTLRYKITRMDSFTRFSVSAEKTQIGVKFGLRADGGTAAITAEYVQEVRPLGSLEARAVRDKDGGGIRAEISFRNISGRTVRSAELTLRASDRGLVVRNRKTGAEETTVRARDAVKDGSRYRTRTSAFWTDFAIDEIKITRVRLTFEDGTTSEYEHSI